MVNKFKTVYNNWLSGRDPYLVFNPVYRIFCALAMWTVSLPIPSRAVDYSDPIWKQKLVCLRLDIDEIFHKIAMWSVRK